MRSRWPILAIFVLSGAAGLIYEIVWSRQLVLVFGNNTMSARTGHIQATGRHHHTTYPTIANGITHHRIAGKYRNGTNR